MTLSNTIFSIGQNLINNLKETALELAECGTPAAAPLDEEGAGMTGHWSATREAMEEALGRPLTEEEVTLLTLGRGYGPTPALTKEGAVYLLKLLWAEGNPLGEWYEWADLAAALEEA